MHLLILAVVLAAFPTWTWERTAALPSSSIRSGPNTFDAIVIDAPRGGLIVWPYYTSVLRGDTLSRHLLGGDTDLVLDSIGVSDSDPYDLTVALIAAGVNNRGRTCTPYVFLGSMTKPEFDAWEATLRARDWPANWNVFAPPWDTVKFLLP